jgi:predicted GIY-YIG superfamily endonuclease
MNNTKIYILKLQNSKFYVGKSHCPQNRILDHFSGNGSEWTKIHKPQSILKQFTGDGFDEEIQTLRTMSIYGIDNVRGGSYSRVVLTEQERTQIIKSLCSAKDQCYHCGSTTHFIKRCPLQSNTSNFRYQSQNKTQTFSQVKYNSLNKLQLHDNIIYKNEDDVQLLKRCTYCFTPKLLTDFNSNMATLDGFDSYCKKCAVKCSEFFSKNNELGNVSNLQPMDLT